MNSVSDDAPFRDTYWLSVREVQEMGATRAMVKDALAQYEAELSEANDEVFAELGDDDTEEDGEDEGEGEGEDKEGDK